MFPIGQDEALSIIKKDKLCYLSDYIALTSRGGPPPAAYAHEGTPGAALLLYQGGGGAQASVVNGPPAFALACLSWLSGAHERLRFTYTAPKAPARLNLGSAYYTERITRTVRYASLAPRDILWNGLIYQRFSRPDAPYARAFREDVKTDAPTLREAFQTHVLGGAGDVYAAMNPDHRVVGYLLCRPVVEDVWDVSYAYVLPAVRDHGIGTALVGYYAEQKRKEGQVPYYSGAFSPSSAKAVEQAGFSPCSESISADLLRL